MIGHLMLNERQKNPSTVRQQLAQIGASWSVRITRAVSPCKILFGFRCFYIRLESLDFYFYFYYH